MTPGQTIGLKIHELRHRAGLTQQQLADRCNGTVMVSTIRDIERGRNGGPRWTTLVALAAGLGVDVKKLTEPPRGDEMPGMGRPVLLEQGGKR